VSACDKYIDDDEYRFGHVLEVRVSQALTSAERLAAVRRENARRRRRDERLPLVSASSTEAARTTTIASDGGSPR
jgi:hypothetical protein